MSNQEPFESKAQDPVRQSFQERQMSRLNRAEDTINDVSSSVAVLRTEADKARGIFGFGRRILVPPDEIHVVVGDGRHILTMASGRKVYGQTANRPSRYWLNTHTEVIKLKTISFTVPIHGHNNLGVEALDIRRHEMRLKQIGRQKSAAETGHEAEMANVLLSQQIGEAEAEKSAHLARIEAEKAAELRALQQKREAEINLAQTEAEAARMAIAQAKEIERKAALTEAEAERLRQEELERANRAKQIALVEASQLAESMQLEAETEAKALKIRVDAQTESELIKAEAEATATEKRAQAAKIRAEATKAETAATGLAEAEVEAARVEVAEKQVSVTRAEGLAEAEVAKAQAVAAAEKMKRIKEVEINAQTQLAKLYEEAPILVDLEKMRMQLAHEEKLATIQAEASLKAFEAIAPGIKLNIFGNGGQAGELLSNIMAFSHGLNKIGEDVPLVANLLGQANGHIESNGNVNLTGLMPKVRPFVPHIKQLVAETNPRLLSSMKIRDIVERLGALVAGEEDLVTSLNTLKDDTGFRVVGDLPVGPFLQMLGLAPKQDKDDLETVTEIPVEDEAEKAKI